MINRKADVQRLLVLAFKESLCPASWSKHVLTTIDIYVLFFLKSLFELLLLCCSCFFFISCSVFLLRLSSLSLLSSRTVCVTAWGLTMVGLICFPCFPLLCPFAKISPSLVSTFFPTAMPPNLSQALFEQVADRWLDEFDVGSRSVCAVGKILHLAWLCFC